MEKQVLQRYKVSNGHIDEVDGRVNRGWCHYEHLDDLEYPHNTNSAKEVNGYSGVFIWSSGATLQVLAATKVKLLHYVNNVMLKQSESEVDDIARAIMDLTLQKQEREAEVKRLRAVLALFCSSVVWCIWVGYLVG